jgi:NADPH:quinone reductase-like Zn-dependent oxidoreductase
MSNTTMQAVRAHDYGGPEVLVLEDAPRPQPEAGQVLVRLLSAGVNPADWKYGGGAYKAFMPLTFPWTPGLEGAGIVEAIGPGVASLKAGQAVYGRLSGSYAEYAAGPETDLFLKPENLSFDQAASVPVGALTAWQAIEGAGIQPGQRVLVHGAAGGVGLYAVQFARLKGAHVFGTSSAANLDFVRSLGAEQAIDYKAGPFESALKDVAVVIDTVGGDIPQRSLAVLRPGGVIASVAARLSLEMGQERNIRVVAPGAAPSGQLQSIGALLVSGQLKPHVGVVFPLAQARQATELCQSGHGRGRIVLHIAD